MTIIKTKDFVLRPVRLSDAENIYRYQQDKEVKRGFMTTPKSVNEVKKDILKSKRDKSGEKFVIDVDGEAVGKISLHFDDPFHKKKMKISYWIAKDYRGIGITTKAVKLVTDYAFKKYKLVRLWAWCRTFNKASARVLEKAGYKLEGISRKNKFKDGKYLDDMMWAKVK
jgi:ribosomal-protein-alanine N-acetyltransferase